MSEGREIARAWSDFLTRNALYCTDKCCAFVRIHAEAETAFDFDTGSEDYKQGRRDYLNSVLAYEKSGGSFKWEGSELVRADG